LSKSPTIEAAEKKREAVPFTSGQRTHAVKTKSFKASKKKDLQKGEKGTEASHTK